MTARALGICCYTTALAGLIYIGITGHQWPIYFVCLMIVLGIIIGIGEWLYDREKRP